jgi:hypothetical protein
VTFKVKISYLEVPLLIGYRFPSSSVRPYIFGGANVGFKTGCSFEAASGGSSVSVGCDDPQIGLDVSSTDIAAVGGVGLDVPTGTSSFRFDLRFALGLTKLAKDAEVKNRGFTLGVAYMIPIGR